MKLSNAILGKTMDKVRVVYMTRDIAKFWNNSRNRKADEPAVFCGFYWINGSEEGGPFKSRMAAYRDAYFRIVLEIKPPFISERTFRRNTK